MSTQRLAAPVPGAATTTRTTPEAALPPDVMKAWQIGRFGLDALEQVQRPVPTPGPHDLLVRVGAASLNYRDRRVADGTFIPDLALPFVPASDGAGEVVAAGKEVTRFHVGDRVIGTYIPKWIDGDGRGPDGDYVSRGGPLPGVLAEYVLFDEHAVVATPPYLDDREAATLPIAGVTAWVALFDHARVRPGDTVLVEGTGGVSLFALQLAVAGGARVIVTSTSDEKLARAKALGAAYGINSARDSEWHQRVLELTAGHGADCILEVVGGANVRRAALALARNGHLALIGLMEGASLDADIVPLLVERRSVRGVLVGSRRHFEDLVRALEILRLHPVIDGVYPFSDVPAAFEHLTRGAFGKVVVDVREVAA
jgi:NADPH:quinone reductase-like Zn-dependent oxidoreductase